MVMGVDPQKLAAMQSVSKFIKALVRIDYKESSLSIILSSDVPEAAALIPQLLEQFSGALAQQLASFFAIEGEIVEVNKPDAKPEQGKQT